MIVKRNFGSLFCSSKEMYAEWKIDNYFSFTPQMDEIWISPIFNLSTVNWYFHLHPQGSEHLYSEGYVGLNVFSKSKCADFPVHFTKGIKRTDGNVYKSVQYFSQLEDAMSHRCFFSTSILLRDKDIIAADGAVTFFFQISPAETENESTASVCLPDNILVRNVSDMLMCQETVDVILKVGNRSFKAHKFILMARSKVFASMFKHDTLESNNSIVDIKDCDVDAFREFLCYLYTAKMNCMCVPQMILIYYIAQKYQVEKLRENCIKFLIANLNVENFCSVVRVALTYDEKELTASVEDFFLKNAQEILVTEAWRKFHQEHVDFANYLFIEYTKRFNK